MENEKAAGQDRPVSLRRRYTGNSSAYRNLTNPVIACKTKLIFVQPRCTISGKTACQDMKERKYKEDWINETQMDEKGKEKVVPVYRGAVFSIPAGQSKQRLVLYALLPWVGYLLLLILYFRLDFPGSRILYIFLPAALSLFPCVYWIMGIWGLFRAPQKMTRIQKETGIGRILRSAAACMVLSCAALIGETVFFFSGGDTAREWPGTLILAAGAALSACAVGVFRSVHSRLSETRSVHS